MVVSKLLRAVLNASFFAPTCWAPLSWGVGGGGTGRVVGAWRTVRAVRRGAATRAAVGLGAVTVTSGSGFGASCEEATSANANSDTSAELLESRRNLTDMGIHWTDAVAVFRTQFECRAIPEAIAERASDRRKRSNAQGHNRRCQAMGGPRAWKECGTTAARSRSRLSANGTGVKTTGTGSTGAAAGAIVPAK